jgi:hypothetical protein
MGRVRVQILIPTVIAVLSFPVVWLVGYQDHPWREPQLAVIAGVLFVGGALSAHLGRRRSEPEVPATLTIAASVVATISLLSAIAWWLFNRLGAF